MNNWPWTRVYLCPSPLTINWPGKQSEKLPYNKQTHASQSDLMVLIIKGQSCFRKRMSDWNNIQKLPKNGDHCERREWFDGSSEEEALQSDVLPPMWWLGPCVGVNCYECQEREGGGALMVLLINLTMETPETWNWPRWSVTDTQVGRDPLIPDVSQLLQSSMNFTEYW